MSCGLSWSLSPENLVFAVCYITNVMSKPRNVTLLQGANIVAFLGLANYLDDPLVFGLLNNYTCESPNNDQAVRDVFSCNDNRHDSGISIIIIVAALVVAVTGSKLKR